MISKITKSHDLDYLSKSKDHLGRFVGWQLRGGRERFFESLDVIASQADIWSKLTHFHTHVQSLTRTCAHSHKLLQSQYQMIFEEQEDHVVFDVKSQENKLDHTHASSSKLKQQLIKMQKVQANQNAILSCSMQYPFVKSNIFSSRCSLVVSDAIYLGCNIFRVTQYIWAAIFSE